MSDLESTMSPHLRFCVQLYREKQEFRVHSSVDHNAQWLYPPRLADAPNMHICSGSLPLVLVLCVGGHVREVRLMYCDGRA